MQVCFIGVGSIAKRHIRNLAKIFAERQETLYIDCVRSGKSGDLDSDTSSYIRKVYTLKDTLDTCYDIIFITNPTMLHYETLMNYRKNAKAYFVEKPVFDVWQLEDIDINSLQLEGQKVYVAAPLRYCAVIQYLKENIDFKKVYSMRCISSSYLPDWRPGTDYRNSYSAHKDMGGGVAMDLVHEWDYIQYLAGTPQKVFSLLGKKSNLEIDAEDIAVYIAEYEGMILELHLDYFGRESRREVQIITDEDTIIGDLISQKVYYLKQNRVVDLTEDRDAYQTKELEYALDIFEGKAENTNDIPLAVKTLYLTGGILK